MKVKPSFLIFCLYTLTILSSKSVFLFAQVKTDSLIYYSELIEKKSGNLTLGIVQSDKLIALASKRKDDYYLLKGLNNKSFLYSKMGDFNSALEVAHTILQKSKKANDSVNLLLAYRN